MEGRIELKYAIGEGVTLAEIIEKPAIDFAITKCLLNLTDTLLYRRSHRGWHLIVTLRTRQ
jgi:hypothetical protein